MTSPTNVKEVRSLLGMVNYVGKFLPNLSTLTTPIRNLLLKENEDKFEWNERHEETFNKIKHLLINATKLAYYDPKKRTILIADAGPEGLGAILAQKHGEKTEIVAYGSRTLSSVEKRYSQIEKETLAVTWAIQHFKIYLVGTHFEMFTDHKPLVSILLNPRTIPSARIERLLLRIQPYNFTPHHQNGSQNPSDYLSRHPDRQNLLKDDKIEAYTNHILTRATPKMIKKEEIVAATEQDSILTLLKVALQQDDYQLWNRQELKDFKQIKNELTIVDNLVLRQSRIVAPQSLHQRLISLAHQGHQGITKTKQLLRTKIWFPAMDKQIEDFVKKCPTCQVTTEDNRRDPIETIVKGSYPFEFLSIDFLGPLPNGKYLLVIVDEFSKFPFTEVCTSTNFISPSRLLFRLFSIFGFPASVQSDNGPPFNGNEYRQWLEEFNIKFKPVTPRWPEANGTPERFVRTIKKILVSSTVENSNIENQIQTFLMNYRATPHPTTGQTPNELFLKRQVRGFLPISPITEQTANHQSQEKARKEKRNNKYNKSKNIKKHNFIVGDRVICKQDRRNKLTPIYNSDP